MKLKHGVWKTIGGKAVLPGDPAGRVYVGPPGHDIPDDEGEAMGLQDGALPGVEVKAAPAPENKAAKPSSNKSEKKGGDK
jgi:hypothetical protein